MPFPPPFEAFVAPARRRPALWRLVPGLGTILIVYLAWLALIGGVAWLLSDRMTVMLWLGRIVVAVDPAPTLLLLVTFAGLALGAMAAARLWHRRGPGSLIGRAPVVLRDFARAALVVWLVYAILTIPALWLVETRPGLDPRTWVLLLPLALAGIALQTLSEEMVFRGYLMQQLAARFRSPWIWMPLPALAFAAAHYDSRANGGNVWYVIAAIFVFALVATDLTRRSGSPGAAWGLHFANNCLALLVLATGGTLPGLALWTTAYRASDPQMVPALLTDAGAMLAIWLILTRLLRR